MTKKKLNDRTNGRMNDKDFFLEKIFAKKKTKEKKEKYLIFP